MHLEPRCGSACCRAAREEGAGHKCAERSPKAGLYLNPHEEVRKPTKEALPWADSCFRCGSVDPGVPGSQACPKPDEARGAWRDAFGVSQEEPMVSLDEQDLEL